MWFYLSFQVFDRFTAVMDVPFECRIESKESHMNLTKYDTAGSQGVKTACNLDWNCKYYSLNLT